MKIKLKKGMNIVCYSGFSCDSMWVKGGSVFDGEYVNEMYGGEKGYYIVDGDYFGDLHFQKSSVVKV